MTVKRRPIQLPDLQALVEQYGGYDKITPEAWKKFDEDRKRATQMIRDGMQYELLQEDR